MGYFLIKNVTNNLAKRDVAKDTTLNINYNVGFIKKTYKLETGNEVALSIRSLPAELHKLRIKNYVQIKEISEAQFKKLQKPSAKKKLATTKNKKPVSNDSDSKKSSDLKKIKENSDESFKTTNTSSKSNSSSKSSSSKKRKTSSSKSTVTIKEENN